MTYAYLFFNTESLVEMSNIRVEVDRNRYCSDIARALQEPRIGTATESKTHIVIALPRSQWAGKLETMGDDPTSIDVVLEDMVTRAGIFARIAKPYDDVVFSARQCDEPDGTLWVFPQGYRFSPDEVQTPAQFNDLLVSAREGTLKHDVVEGGAPGDAHFVMVCTHHSRDLACGIYSKPVIRALNSAAENADADIHIWEISHIGQHRFAATMIVQPQNRWYGGLTAADAQPLIDALQSGRVLTAFSRGSANYQAHEQVAENWAWSYFESVGRVGEIVNIETETIDTNSGHASIVVTLRYGDTTFSHRLTLRGSAYEFITSSLASGTYTFENEQDMHDTLNPTKIRLLWQIAKIVPLND